MIGGYRSGERETVMPIAPLFHANGWQMPFTAPMNGHKLVLPGRSFEPERLHELIQAESVTIAAAVPTLWLSLVDFRRRRGGFGLAPLRAALLAGTKAPRTLVESLERFGVTVGQTWGMTEAPGVVKATLPPGTAELHAGRADERASCGRDGSATARSCVSSTRPGRRCRRDGEAIGQLQVRGPVVAAAYYKQEAPLMDGWL